MSEYLDNQAIAKLSYSCLKKGYRRQSQNYPLIELISHPSKVMPKVIQNCLMLVAEELLAKEQAAFQTGMSTVEQIFNNWVLIKKHLQHSKDFYHNFIDFKKHFDSIWNEELWNVLHSFNVEEGLVHTTKELYNACRSLVLFHIQVDKLFPTTVCVFQRCSLSSELFNIYLEKIMHRTLQDHRTSMSVEGDDSQ